MRKPVGRKVLRPIFPNAGIRARYERRLIGEIRAMADSVEYWAKAIRRKESPRLAEDATPSQKAAKEIKKLSVKWQKHFDKMAEAAARNFIHSQYRATDQAFRHALLDAGWSIKFEMTPDVRDAMNASLAENVQLIKSIPSQYLSEVQGIVMRNYASGLDLKSMVKEIQTRYGVTSRRAYLIARDQSSKASSVVQRARQMEIGITEAVWMHSRASKEPRRTHLAMDGKTYKVEKGMWDSDVQKWIFPSQLINCHCQSLTVLPSAFGSK